MTAHAALRHTPGQPGRKVFRFFWPRRRWRVADLDHWRGGGCGLSAAHAPEVRSTLRRQPALSFAVGLLVNMVGVAVIGFMAITICLAPPAALLGLALLVANVIGLSGAGAAVANQLTINLGSSHVARTAVGVALPARWFLWLLGGCFAFFGYVFAILLASFGLGAFLVKLLKLGEPAPVVASRPNQQGQVVHRFPSRRSVGSGKY